MSSSADMRRLLNLTNPPDDAELLTLCRISSIEPVRLNEAQAGHLLTEGQLAELIKASSAKITSRYNDMKYELLAKITAKAMAIFAKTENGSQINRTLRRISKVGKFAVQNRALIAILIGMVGVLIGMSHHPATAVNASAKMDQALNGSLDDIIHKLQASGIDLNAETGDAGTLASILQGLPPEISSGVEKVAKALRAIEAYEFKGDNVSSESQHLSDVSITGDVQKLSDTFNNHIRVTTLDNKIVLGEYSVQMVDGKMTEVHGGVKNDLANILNQITKLPKDKADSLMNYVTRGNAGAREFVPQIQQPNQFIATLMQNKMAIISAAIVAAGMRAANGHYRFRFGPEGVQLSGGKPGTPAAPGASQTAPQAASQPASAPRRKPSNEPLWRNLIKKMQQTGVNPADPANARSLAARYKAMGGTWVAA